MIAETNNTLCKTTVYTKVVKSDTEPLNTFVK